MHEGFFNHKMKSIKVIHNFTTKMRVVMLSGEGVTTVITNITGMSADITGILANVGQLL
jgi:hypothetical protein